MNRNHKKDAQNALKVYRMRKEIETDLSHIFKDNPNTEETRKTITEYVDQTIEQVYIKGDLNL